MKENFNRTIVFDFSKMSEADMDRFHDVMEQLMPGITEVIHEEMRRPKRTLTISDVLNSIAEDMHCSVQTAIHALRLVNRSNLGAAYSTILRAIAVEMDKAYKDNITKLDEVWVYSFLDAKIYKQATNIINKNAWKYFAAFRSREEAIAAVKLTQAVRHAIFK